MLPDGLLDVGVDYGIDAHEHLHPEEAVAEALIQAVELGVESDDGAGHPDPDPVPILSRSECVGKWIESWVVLANAFRWSQSAARFVPRTESTPCSHGQRDGCHVDAGNCFIFKLDSLG